MQNSLFLAGNAFDLGTFHIFFTSYSVLQDILLEFENYELCQL